MPRTCCVTPEDQTAVKRSLDTGDPAEGAVKLELEDIHQEIPGIRRIGGHVILGPRVEVVFGPGQRRSDALILLA